MPAHAAHLNLPDISGLRPVLPWHEVDRLQGVQSFHGDPARALLDLWPVFRRQGATQRPWSGKEQPIEVLTACWRDYTLAVAKEAVPFSVNLEQDGRGYFITAEISLQDYIPQDMMLYWADLRQLPRLRECSPRLWEYVSDGLALLILLGVDTHERYEDWFRDYFSEFEDAEHADGVQVIGTDVRDEARQIETLAPQILGVLRKRCGKDLASRFERRVRRAAVAPAWVEWGRQILTATRDLGKVWDLVDQDMVENGDFDGEFFTSMFALFWCSPRFLEMSTELFNDQMNNTGIMLPMIRGQLRGGKLTLAALQKTAGTRGSGLRALALALEGYNTLVDQACGVIDDDPR